MHSLFMMIRYPRSDSSMKLYTIGICCIARCTKTLNRCSQPAALSRANTDFRTDRCGFAGIKAIDEFVYPFVQQALDPSMKQAPTGPNDKYTFLNALAEFTQDPQMLRDQVISTLIAGRDTTGSALSWVFYELGRHPEVVEKLRSEIQNIVGLTAQPTYENLKNMKYLQVNPIQSPRFTTG
jgi:cytochrome P450